MVFKPCNSLQIIIFIVIASSLTKLKLVQYYSSIHYYSCAIENYYTLINALFNEVYLMFYYFSGKTYKMLKQPFLTSNDVEQGLLSCCEYLNELILDTPNAPKVCSIILLWKLKVYEYCKVYEFWQGKFSIS